jgi:hypothetical protein
VKTGELAGEVLEGPPYDVVGGMKLLAQTLPKMPKQLAAKTIMAVQGYRGASVADKGLGDRFIESARKDADKLARKMAKEHKTGKFLPGISMEDLAALNQSLAFSGVAMGGGAAVGAPIAAIPLPGMRPLGVVAGAYVSGGLAFNMASYEIMQEFLEAKNEEMQAKKGRGLTLAEERRLKSQFAKQATRYGLWEAIPEGIGNAAMYGIALTPLKKMVGRSLAIRIATKVAGMYGPELATETVTEMGQMGVRAEAGLPGGREVDWTSPTDWLAAFKQIAPQTFLLTTIMGGAGAGAVEAARAVTARRAVQSLQEEIGDDPDFQKFAEKIQQVPPTEEVAAEEAAEPIEGIEPDQLAALREVMNDDQIRQAFPITYIDSKTGKVTRQPTSRYLPGTPEVPAEGVVPAGRRAEEMPVAIEEIGPEEGVPVEGLAPGVPVAEEMLTGVDARVAARPYDKESFALTKQVEGTEFVWSGKLWIDVGQRVTVKADGFLFRVTGKEKVTGKLVGVEKWGRYLEGGGREVDTLALNIQIDTTEEGKPVILAIPHRLENDLRFAPTSSPTTKVHAITTKVPAEIVGDKVLHPEVPTEPTPPRPPEIAPTVEADVAAVLETPPVPEEAVTPPTEAPPEPVEPIRQPVPGEYAEHDGKSEQQFIDESPPIGLGVRQVVPPQVEIVKEPKDLVGLSSLVKRWVSPARTIALENPIVNRVIHMGRDTLAGLANQQSQYAQRIRQAYKGLNKQEQEDLVEYLESPVGAQKVPDNLRPAFTEINAIRREAYEMVRDEMGVDVSKWGMSPEEYWPHIFVGSYEILYESTGPQGKPVWKHIEGGFSRNIREAVDKAAEYLTDDPDANIRIEPRGFNDDYSATLLSRKGFFRFIGEVEKATQLDKDEIVSMMRGVAAIKPRGKFVGNFKQRETNLGGYMKGPRAMDIYISRILRKKWLDPFRKEATELTTALPPGLRKYFNEYIDDVSGRYDPYDRNFSISRNLSRVTRAQSHLKLGYRPVTAFVNRLQPLQIAFPEIGHYLFRGMAFKRTAAGKALIEESGVRGEVPKYAAGEPAYRVRPTEPIYKPLGLFSKAEMANREDVIAGGYLFARKVFQMPRRTAFAVGDEVTVPTMVKGRMMGLPGTVADVSEGSATVTLADGSTVKSTLDDLDWQKPAGRGLTAERMGYGYILEYLNTYGDPHRAALEYAKDLNADVNFIYNAADLPKMFRTQAGRVAFQFKTYPINFLATTMKWTLQRPDNPHYYARLGRLIAINTGLAGVRTVPYVGRKIWKALVLAPLLIPLIGEENRDRAKRVLGRGFFSMLGVDLSQRLGPNEFLPRNVRDLLGPLAGDVYSFYRFVQDDWDWKQLTRAVPLIRDIYRAIGETEYIADPNKRMRKVAEATGWDKAMQAAGLPLEKVTVTRDMQFIFNEMEREYKRKKAQYVDSVVGKLLDDESPLEDIRDAFAEGIPLDTRDFVDELIRKGTPQLIRELKTMPKPLRPEAIQMLQKVNRVHKVLQTERKKAGLPPPQKPPTTVPWEELQ